MCIIGRPSRGWGLVISSTILPAMHICVYSVAWKVGAGGSNILQKKYFKILTIKIL